MGIPPWRWISILPKVMGGAWAFHSPHFPCAGSGRFQRFSFMPRDQGVLGHVSIAELWNLIFLNL